MPMTRKRALKGWKTRRAAAKIEASRAAAEPNDEYLTPQQTGTITHKSVGALGVWRCLGLGPPYAKIGGKILYNRKLLFEWMAARTIVPKPRKRAAA